eukprot:g2446.t1
MTSIPDGGIDIAIREKRPRPRSATAQRVRGLETTMTKGERDHQNKEPDRSLLSRGGREQKTQRDDPASASAVPPAAAVADLVKLPGAADLANASLKIGGADVAKLAGNSDLVKSFAGAVAGAKRDLDLNAVKKALTDVSSMVASGEKDASVLLSVGSTVALMEAGGLARMPEGEKQKAKADCGEFNDLYADDHCCTSCYVPDEVKAICDQFAKLWNKQIGQYCSIGCSSLASSSSCR